jgi:hypothetical protein
MGVRRGDEALKTRWTASSCDAVPRSGRFCARMECRCDDAAISAGGRAGIVVDLVACGGAPPHGGATAAPPAMVTAVGPIPGPARLRRTVESLHGQPDGDGRRTSALRPVQLLGMPGGARGGAWGRACATSTGSTEQRRAAVQHDRRRDARTACRPWQTRLDRGPDLEAGDVQIALAAARRYRAAAGRRPNRAEETSISRSGSSPASRWLRAEGRVRTPTSAQAGGRVSGSPLASLGAIAAPPPSILAFLGGDGRDAWRSESKALDGCRPFRERFGYPFSRWCQARLPSFLIDLLAAHSGARRRRRLPGWSTSCMAGPSAPLFLRGSFWFESCVSVPDCACLLLPRVRPEGRLRLQRRSSRAGLGRSG